MRLFKQNMIVYGVIFSYYIMAVDGDTPSAKPMMTKFTDMTGIWRVMLYQIGQKQN